MALGGEVHHGVRLLILKHRQHKLLLGDVALDELIARRMGHRSQVFQVAGVGKLVEYSDLRVRPLSQHQPDEGRTDKSGAAGNEILHSSSWPPGFRFRSVSATRFVARSRESNVPASVHQPSRKE